jgi:hypothetical protein
MDGRRGRSVRFSGSSDRGVVDHNGPRRPAEMRHSIDVQVVFAVSGEGVRGMSRGHSTARECGSPPLTLQRERAGAQGELAVVRWWRPKGSNRLEADLPVCDAVAQPRRKSKFRAALGIANRASQLQNWRSGFQDRSAREPCRRKLRTWKLFDG